MQVAGGLDYPVYQTEKLLRRNLRLHHDPRTDRDLFLTIFAGTGNISGDTAKVIAGCEGTGVKPARPLSTAVVLAQRIGRSPHRQFSGSGFFICLP